jgi:hypothetical protein
MARTVNNPSDAGRPDSPDDKTSQDGALPSVGDGDPRRVSILPDVTKGDLEDIDYCDFRSRATENLPALFAFLSTAWAFAKEARDELRARNLELEEQLVAQEELIEKKDQAITDLVEERDRHKHIAEYIELRGGSVAREEPKKKGLPDPKHPLTDGKSPKFEDWLSMMENRFIIMDREYPTEQHRIAYIQTQIEGFAKEQIGKRFLKDNPRRFETVVEIFEALKVVFYNPNRVQEALDKFRDLQMKSTQKYHDFLTTFTHHASEAEIPLETYKRELYSKLTPALRSMTWSQYNDAAITFESFSALCNTAAYTFRTNLARENKPAASPSPALRVSPAPRMPQITTSASSTAATTPKKRMNEVERLTLRKEGKCFYCKEAGHIAINCPRIKAKVDLKALEQTFEGDQFESEKEAP